MTTAQPFDMARFMKEFLEFEVKEGLFEIRIKGHCFWEYIRYSVFYQCAFAQYGQPYTKTLTRSDYLGEILACLRALAREWFTPASAYDIIVVNYNRTNTIDGRQRNVHTYPLIKELSNDYRILVIERSRLRLVDEQTYPCDVMRFRPFHLLDRLKSKLTRFSATELAAIQEIGRKVRARFGVEVDLPGLAREVFAFQLQTRARYLKLFRKYSPKAVVYADDANMKGTIAAARGTGVVSIDLQHSLVSAINPLYTYVDVPALQEHTIRSDYVFTYGEFWHPEYRLPVKLLPVGWPYLEEKLDSARVDDSDRTKSIIVIGQRISRDIVVEAALEVARRLPDFTVYYKLRSEEYESWRSLYPHELQTTPNLVVIDSNERSLIEWFGRCQYQIGINSTALCEGLACGLTTFVLRREWYGEMTALVEAGGVFLVADGVEIVAKIRAGAQPPRHIDRDELFKRDSLKNLRSAIEEAVAARRGEA